MNKWLQYNLLYCHELVYFLSFFLCCLYQDTILTMLLYTPYVSAATARRYIHACTAPGTCASPHQPSLTADQPWQASDYTTLDITVSLYQISYLHLTVASTTHHRNPPSVSLPYLPHRDTH